MSTPDNLRRQLAALQRALRERQEALDFTEQIITQAQAEGNNLRVDRETNVAARINEEIANLQTQISDKETELSQAVSQETQTNSAAGQTAEQKVKNDTTPTSSGAGETSTATNETNLSDKELKKLNSTDKDINQTATEDDTTSVNDKDERGHVDVESSGAAGREAEAADEEPLQPIGSNALHSYTSYTYRITLFLLTDQDYTNLADSPSTFEPRWSLISSGGGFNPEFTGTVEVRIPGYDATAAAKNASRHPDFREDFYFENLSLTTVVGLNSKTKASNSVEISFNIVEPYGLSLLDRLMSACMYPDGPQGAPSGFANYIEQPYLLQIDFLANTNEVEAGKNLITTKRIAIKIVEIKVKPGANGTEYRCKAIPFNHSAFQQTVAACPISLSVTASTVEEYFDSQDTLSKIFDSTSGIAEERVESELNKWKQTWQGDNPPTLDEINLQREKIKSSTTYTVKSLPAAYNSYMDGLAKTKRFTLPPNLINIFVDEKMKKATLVDETKQDTRNTPLVDSNKSFSLSVAKGAERADYKSTSVFNIHAGTDIPSLIDRVMMSSSYIRNQVEDLKKTSDEIAQQNGSSFQPGLEGVQAGNGQLPTVDSQRSGVTEKSKFLDWYKVVPQIYLNGFDKKANAYSKIVNFSIIPYKVPNSYHPDFQKTKVPTSKVVREYNYLYTGLNQDIISMDIDFDATYYTAIGTYQKEKMRGLNYAGADIESVGNQSQENAGQNTQPTSIPVPVRPVNNPSQESVYKLNQDPKDFSVSSLAKSIYSSSRGDMLNVKIRIVGDPAFIKQDDIYYNPMSPEYSNFVPTPGSKRAPVNNTTGQILFDTEQVFVKVNVLNAVDIDDTTGITNKQVLLSNGRSTNGTFSGLYRVLTVKSDFSRGKFEQTLDLVRLPDEVVDNGKFNATVEKTVPTSGTLSTDESDGNTISTVDVDNENENVETVENVSDELRIAADSLAIVPSQPSDVAQEKALPLTFTI